MREHLLYSFSGKLGRNFYSENQKVNASLCRYVYRLSIHVVIPSCCYTFMF